MDLTIPYTFYPLALPHWMAWVLFILAILGGVAAGFRQDARHGWPRRLGVGLLGTSGCLLGTIIASMVITFFLHDQ
jgi:hypothetical protein